MEVVIAREVTPYRLESEQRMFSSSLFLAPDGKWLHICTIIETSRDRIAALEKQYGPPYTIVTDSALVRAIDLKMPMPSPRGCEEDDD